MPFPPLADKRRVLRGRASRRHAKRRYAGPKGCGGAAARSPRRDRSGRRQRPVLARPAIPGCRRGAALPPRAVLSLRPPQSTEGRSRRRPSPPRGRDPAAPGGDGKHRRAARSPSRPGGAPHRTASPGTPARRAAANRTLRRAPPPRALPPSRPAAQAYLPAAALPSPRPAAPPHGTPRQRAPPPRGAPSVPGSPRRSPGTRRSAGSWGAAAAAAGAAPLSRRSGTARGDRAPLRRRRHGAQRRAGCMAPAPGPGAACERRESVISGEPRERRSRRSPCVSGAPASELPSIQRRDPRREITSRRSGGGTSLPHPPPPSLPPAPLRRGRGGGPRRWAPFIGRANPLMRRSLGGSAGEGAFGEGGGRGGEPSK